MEPTSAQIRVGITGHLDLTADTTTKISRAIHGYLSALCDPADLVGVTCLARGADTVFAQELISLGGRLEIILPSSDYQESQVHPRDTSTFLTMLRMADSVVTMPAPRAGEEAYVAANERMLATINLLIAVWDGRPNGGAGGTVNVIRTARDRAIPVKIIWPAGSRRESTPAGAVPEA